jgi:8-oxo-dGTP pyrophosphatase MutT (NUDIX family)
MADGAIALDADGFARRLAAHEARDPSDVLVRRRAAVAAVLRFDRGGPEVLLIQRAEHPGDRWSGQVSMPGGRHDPGDPDLLATAMRETREETGVDLAAAPVLGRLGAVRAIARGKILPMTITPYVFHLRADQPVVLNREATAHFWLPLDRAARGELDDRYEYKLGPLPLRLACWRWDGRTVWGLTHQMLSGLIDVVRR